MGSLKRNIEDMDYEEVIPIDDGEDAHFRENPTVPLRNLDDRNVDEDVEKLHMLYHT